MSYKCKGYELIQTVVYGDGFVYETGRLTFETEVEIRTAVNTLKKAYLNDLSNDRFRGQELTVQLRVFRHTEQGIPILISSEELANSFTPSTMGWTGWSYYEDEFTCLRENR